LIVERAFLPLEGGLALAAILATIEALTFAPLLLPLAVGLLATELVVSVHRGALALWTVPLLAVGLLLVYEAGDLRHRLPPDSVVESAPLRALAGRLALTAALGLLASVTVLATAGLSSRGGAAAAVIGGLALAAAVLLVRMLAANGSLAATDLERPGARP
jgi:hypothetical protein